ncbi:MAG: hypothetical protein EPO51_12285 [Phenylobacterium sp.]|uniref:hypothetical protein n=1 Tax=Phenylobacterium sp. TaxID=1871053 RepID=UPI00120BF5C2|nr:hypothetical protein [Phenylobacterium sp.]TAJ71890.1 MAG: hypothetical protein EPO51_12285 [Phenylobacterium sp.]
MKLRLAVSALTALAIAAGAPALALAQGMSGNVEASTPVPNPPAKTAHKAAHHAKAKATHRKAAATTAK